MRTGQNTQETILTPANVNPTQFGLLFSHWVNGEIFTQPLYVPSVTMAVDKAAHNVVYVGTLLDSVYAFDADSNGGVNASPLWNVNLLTTATQGGVPYTNNTGVQGTPVIDKSTKTMYLVSSELLNGNNLYRLHALDITSGKEKFGGPVQITATVPGSGSGSVNSELSFSAPWQWQRPGLLLLNGVVYVGFGSIGDVGPWHGWIMSYSAATLSQMGTFCTTPNGSGGGIWMAGAGLAGEVVDSVNKPYGRMFLATGNGSYSIGSPTVSGQPYSNPANDYSMSVLDLDLTNGIPTVEDAFTPSNQALLDGQDGDLGSGGPILLPTQTIQSGASAGLSLKPLLEIGKSGMIYVLDRDNNADGSNKPATEVSPAGLGGYNTSADQVYQEVQTPKTGAQGWGAGVWGSSAYWNNSIYFSGSNPGVANSFAAYSFVNGVLSSTPTSTTFQQFSYPAPTPSISSNGTTNGIAWVADTHDFVDNGPETLYAYDATNLVNLLYSSAANPTRDNPGSATREVIPTVANGKVYLGASSQFNVYGLLGTVPTTPSPVISPVAGTFSGSQQVTICFNSACSAVTGGTIYYTLNGSIPTSSSSIYTGPFSISSSETVTAIASVTGQLQSAPVSVTYSSTSNATNPVFSLAAGTYAGTQRLTITDATAGASICYTIDGTTPTATSNCYTPSANGNVPLTISVAVSETVQAIATSPSLLPSTVISATYTITPLYNINFTNGFTQAQSSGLMTFNGSTDLDDFRLQLTNGGQNEAGSAFYTQPVNIQAFTTDFTFQLSNPAADGITFTIQGAGPTALGGNGAGLGFVTIQDSVGIKFDLFNNAGEGSDSTGLYYWGNTPTNVGSIDLSSTPINLHSGDYFYAHVTYDGINLTLTLTDSVSSQSWSHEWAINIPQKVGSNMGWVGFTGSTGGATASQKISSWTFISAQPTLPNYPTGFDGLMAVSGAWVNGTSLQMTSGGQVDDNSAYYWYPVNVESFSSSFDFTVNPGSTSTLADGFAFVLQNDGHVATGQAGGGLGYAGLSNSLAIKFDFFNNAGEGPSSTGVYVNGAMPTTPFDDLTAPGIGVMLGSGDKFNVQVNYDGTTLTWRITDETSPNPHDFEGFYTVNIPHVIGSNTAYVGFTASGTDGTSTIDILDWTYSNSMP